MHTFLHFDQKNPKPKQKTQAKLNGLTYLDDHSHVAWCMFSYTLVVECHRGQGGKSRTHHNNKLTRQNLKKQVKYIHQWLHVFAFLHYEKPLNNMQMFYSSFVFY